VQALGDALDDPHVGLMRDHDRDVVEPQTGLDEGLLGGVGHRLHGELEDFAALHRDEVLAELDGLLGGWDAARAGLHHEQLALRALAVQDDRLHADRRVRGLNDDRAGAVAEEHARAAVLEVEQA
jgi:hypothetical protein